MDPASALQTDARMLLVQLAIYAFVYGLAGYVIGRKLQHRRPWLAWVPLANLGYYCALANRSWSRCTLFAVPVVQIFVWVSCFREIARRLGLSEAMGVCMIIPGADLIAIAVMALFGQPDPTPRRARRLADAVGHPGVTGLPVERSAPVRAG